MGMICVDQMGSDDTRNKKKHEKLLEVGLRTQYMYDGSENRSRWKARMELRRKVSLGRSIAAPQIA